MDEIDTREARRGAGFSSEAARGAPVGSEPRRPRRRRLGNAFVRALLRSPAHRLLSGSLVLIRVRGRRTGTLRTFPVMYAREGDSLWVVCGEADRKSWWRNLQEPAPVGLRLRGKEYRARGRAILGRREPAIATGGLAAWVRRFPKAGPGWAWA